jgi:hypothetical protein
MKRALLLPLLILVFALYTVHSEIQINTDCDVVGSDYANRHWIVWCNEAYLWREYGIFVDFPYNVHGVEITRIFTLSGFKIQIETVYAGEYTESTVRYVYVQIPTYVEVGGKKPSGGL